MSEDLARIQRNMAKLQQAGAPLEDINSYLAEEGMSLDAYKAATLQARRDQRTPGQRFGRDLALGARNVAEGVAALPGLVYDVAALPQNLLSNVPGLEFLRTKPAATQIREGLDAAGAPIPETDAERLTGRVAQDAASTLTGAGIAGRVAPYLSGVAQRVTSALAGAVPEQVAGAVVGAGAGDYARRSGWGSEYGDAGRAAGEVGATVAGNVAGSTVAGATRAAGGLLRGIVEPFSRTGQERIAADALLQASADPRNLEGRIRAGLDDPSRRLPGSIPTTAQAARDPGLAVLEQGVRSDVIRPQGQPGPSGAVLIRDAEALRNQNRMETLQGMASGPTAAEAGENLRALLGAQQARAGGDARRAYEAIPGYTRSTIPADDLANRASRAAHAFYGPGAAPMPAELREALDVLQHPEVLSLEVLDNLQRRLSGIASQARMSGDNVLNGAASSARRELETAFEAAVARGDVPADQGPALAAARALRRSTGERYDRSTEGADAVSRVLDRDQFGRPTMQSEKVPGALMATEASTRQALAAGAGPILDAGAVASRLAASNGGRMHEVRATLRQQFMREALDRATTTGTVIDAAGTPSRNLSGPALIRFIEDNRGVVDLLFPTSADRYRLTQLVNDFAETSAVNMAGRARGSDTAQNLSVGNLISRLSNGLIDPGSQLAQTAGGFGPILRRLYSAPEAATRDLLARAIVDPHLAGMLLARATPANVQRAARYIERTGVERIGDAAADWGVRRGAGAVTAVQSTERE